MPLTTAETSSSPVQPPIAAVDARFGQHGSGRRQRASDRCDALGGHRFPPDRVIVLNLDASLRVHARAHFFSWTQGLLQSLIRHELLICTLCLGKPPAFRADGFSMTTPDPSTLSDIFLRDTAVGARAAEGVGREALSARGLGFGGAILLGSGAFARDLERLGATQLLVHGVHDADGRALTLFTFACRPGSIGPRQTYLAQLLTPALHASWVRTQLQRTPTSADKASSQSVLTVRELDILKWIYLGKSKFEIGAILKISPLDGEEPRAEDPAQAERRQPHAGDRQVARASHPESLNSQRRFDRTGPRARFHFCS